MVQGALDALDVAALRAFVNGQALCGADRALAGSARCGSGCQRRWHVSVSGKKFVQGLRIAAAARSAFQLVSRRRRALLKLGRGALLIPHRGWAGHVFQASKR